MKQKDINKLLERFLDGETTLQEERRLYAYFSQDDVPEELKAYQEMFRAYAAVASKTERKPVVVRPLWRRVAALAAAACLITAVLISYTLYINTESKEQKKEDVQLAETIQVEPTPAPSPSDLPPSKEVIAEESTHSPEPAKVKKTSPKPSLPKEKESAPQTEKSLPAPSQMDDFIAQLAAYYKVDQLPVDCIMAEDSNALSTVYVFPDTEEESVLDKLLQAACCYDDETPGYYLTFSPHQFFFELKDEQKQLKYLWLAERSEGQILLYSTHSSISTTGSSDCFLNARNQLIHTNTYNSNPL